MNYKKRKMSSCQFCDEEDNMRMVQCDRCDKWSHYDCVGVDNEIANLAFICPLCTEMIGELQALKSDFQQQQEKYKLALYEHEVYKQTLNETSAATDAKFNSLVAVVRKQKGALKRMAEEASTVSEELKNVLSKLTELTTKPVGSDMEDPKNDYGKLNDEELAVLIYMKLPCDSEPQLEVFRDEIINPKNFLFVQKSFLMFGGNINKFIASMLNKILSKELRKKLSLSGNRAKKDSALVDFPNVMNLIHSTAKLKFD